VRIIRSSSISPNRRLKTRSDWRGFDALARGFITTAEFVYGVTDDFQVGASIGYFAAMNFAGLIWKKMAMLKHPLPIPMA